MLTLHLTLTDHQVGVRANGKESHQFSLLDLSQSEQEWKDFYKNPRVYGGLGIAILSTPQGVMTGQQAWRRQVGGEILCYVW